MVQRFFVILLATLSLASAAFADGSGENHIVSNVPGNFTNGTNINTLIGADRFYNAGFIGQGTIAANVEAGHIWNSHQSLQHVTQFANDASAFGTTTADLFDRHATWVGSHLGGRNTGTPVEAAWQNGIAYGTDLRSGAIATGWNGSAYSLNFRISGESLDGGYAPYFGTADVINSSWGGNDATGTGFIASRLDGYAAVNPNTTLVASAGNSGPGANTIGSPGSGYNAITVAALANGGDNSYDTVANFSSRGPQDYADPTNGTVVGGRAAIDIAAPGTNLHAAFYGGQTGGNNTTLTGSTPGPPNTNFYNFSVAGTSFASPIVAGAVALVKSASYNSSLASNAASRDTRVVKSVLMNSASKTVGWDNGQTANASGGVTTTQALDYATGAGALNLGQAFEQYVNAGTQDVTGLGNGDLGSVASTGWDFGNVLLGDTNSYAIAGLLEAGSLFNVTLNWFRDRTLAFTEPDIAQADLTLRVIDLATNLVISESSSLYNTSEHLSFLLPSSSTYGIDVVYGANTFDLSGSKNSVQYGLAWSTSAVPEPSSMTMMLLSTSLLFRRKRQLSNAAC
jgi:hypothetical protein